jgi:hypothetical protein
LVYSKEEEEKGLPHLLCANTQEGDQLLFSLSIYTSTILYTFFFSPCRMFKAEKREGALSLG